MSSQIMGKCTMKSTIASICIWMIILAGYPFDFRYAFGYPFMIPILAGLSILIIMMLERKLQSYLAFNLMYAILAVFWMLQMVCRIDEGYFSNIFQVFCIAILYLAIINFVGTEKMSRQFVHFMIANCIGGTIITLLLFFYNIPPCFQFEQHDGRTGYFYYLTFTNTAFITDSFTAIRYSGLFDEPGNVSFGCMFALILNRLLFKNRTYEMLLLILPLFTFSLAHFVTSILYVAFFYCRKMKQVFLYGILLFGLYILLNSTKDTQYDRIYKLTLARLEVDADGELAGNNRADDGEICRRYFMQRPLTGWGKTFFDEGQGKGNSVNGTNIYYNGALYGVLGYIFPYILIHYMIFSLLLKCKTGSKSLDGLKCCLLIIANLFQRSYVTSIFPLFALTLIALCIREMTKSEILINVSLCNLQKKKSGQYLQS